MSTASTHSTHPLRQTSFPPDGLDPRSYSPSARSPSVDTASLVSGSIAAGKAGKKRGRKPKHGDDAGSLVGGRASTAVSIVSAGRNQRDGTRGASPEEDEDEGGEAMDVKLVARTNEEKEKEKYYRSLLVDALDPDQYARYERWRSSKLADPVVRRVSALLPFCSPNSRQFDVLTVPQLVNQTLSQSVPFNVVIAVKSVAKVFAGEIIELARKVQSQYLSATTESPTAEPDEPSARGQEEGYTDADIAQWERNRTETRRPPLTPDHLREALRRYKFERGGGLVGLMGLDRSQHPTGVERFGNRVRGRRLLG